MVIGLSHNINTFDEQIQASGYSSNKVQNRDGLGVQLGEPADHGAYQASHPASSKAVYKSKRVTANTRGITSGTNARVNTFDNRGMQAAQQNPKKDPRAGHPAQHATGQMLQNPPASHSIRPPSAQAPDRLDKRAHGEL